MTLDLLALAACLGWAVWGWRRGALSAGLGLAGLLGGYAAALAFHRPAGRFLFDLLPLSSVAAPLVAGAALFGATVLVVHAAGRLLARRRKARRDDGWKPPAIDRAGGAVLGAATAGALVLALGWAGSSVAALRSPGGGDAASDPPLRYADGGGESARAGGVGAARAGGETTSAWVDGAGRAGAADGGAPGGASRGPSDGASGGGSGGGPGGTSGGLSGGAAGGGSGGGLDGASGGGPGGIPGGAATAGPRDDPAGANDGTGAAARSVVGRLGVAAAERTVEAAVRLAGGDPRTAATTAAVVARPADARSALRTLVSRDAVRELATDEALRGAFYDGDAAAIAGHPGLRRLLADPGVRAALRSMRIVDLDADTPESMARELGETLAPLGPSLEELRGDPAFVEALERSRLRERVRSGDVAGLAGDPDVVWMMGRVREVLGRSGPR